MQDKSGAPLKTIDGVSDSVVALRKRLCGGDKLTARELRALWSQRLRPFWRLHIELYRALARRFLENGDNYLASEVADEGGQFFGDDVALILIRALATARSGAPQAAQNFLAQKQAVLADAEEAKSLLARTFKDLWKSSGEERYLRESFELYHLDYTTTKGDRTFPGVNAASMARFLGRTGDAKQIAREVLGLLRQKPDVSGYWDAVTIAECLLVAGEIEEARELYAKAAGAGQVAHAHLATTRAQARLLLRHLGRGESDFDSCFPLPGVLAFTGHRIDAPDRPYPRFPESLVPEIKERIREAIADSKAGFGYSAAASGADILFLECMQEAGLETFIHLPLPEQEFLQTSVLDSASLDWLERYRAVAARATEFTAAIHGGGALDFDYGNRLLLGAATQHARQLGSDLRLLAVWDGAPGDVGNGGTADYIRMAREAGCAIQTIELPGAREPAIRPDLPEAGSPDKILSILTFAFDHNDEGERRLAALFQETEIFHREVSGNRIRLYFTESHPAGQAARAIARNFPTCLSGALGLHTGPVQVTNHPLTGEMVIRGGHSSLSDDLAALEPAGLIYASAAYASLLGLDAGTDTRTEFLGFRSLRSGNPREPVFQVVP